MSDNDKQLQEISLDIIKAMAAKVTGDDDIDVQDAVKALAERGEPNEGNEAYREITKAAADAMGIPYTDDYANFAAGTMKEIMQSLFEDVSPEQILEQANKTSAATLLKLEGATQALKEKLTPEFLEQMKATTDDVQERFAVSSDRWQDIREALNSFKRDNPVYMLVEEITGELAPYIEEELKKPQYEGREIYELFNEAADSDLPFNQTLFAQAVDAAREAKRLADMAEKPLPQIAYKRKHDIALTLGKSSIKLFDPKVWGAVTKRGQIPGQLSFIPMKYEGAGEEEITLYCGMTENSFRSALSPEDYFLLSFIGDAFTAGNKMVTISKFYKEVTGTRGNSTQLTETYNKLSELQSTQLVIRDGEVRRAWDKKKGVNSKATYKEIRQQAAPITLGAERYMVNGKVAEAVIKIHDFPAILKVDLDIGQYTTVPKSLLQVKKKDGRYLRRTSRYYAVLHYLIHRIARIKKGKAVNKILYSKFYDEIGETTARGQQLALEMFFTMLDHFKSEGWITGYKEETTKSTGEVGVKFTWHDADGKALSDKRKTSRKRS